MRECSASHKRREVRVRSAVRPVAVATAVAALLAQPALAQRRAGPSPQVEARLCTRPVVDVCVAAASSFPASTPVIHGWCFLPFVPRPNARARIAWIADDVGSVAPPGTLIATSDVTVTPVRGATSYTITFHLTRPTAGWPVGRYHVAVELDGERLATASFRIVPR